MIKSLILKNFKNIKEQTYNFTQFDLLVGRNNSGKSTILQSLAIWQFCINEFHRSKRSGSRGIQIVLPNFTALPLPEFNLLWFAKTERKYPQKSGGKKQEFIYIEIIVKWNMRDGKEEEFGILLRYQSPQSVYAIPNGGWKKFKELDEKKFLPKIVFVPPFSGLEPFEEWRDDSILKKQVGKAHPGSVLRNLLYRVVDKTERDNEENDIRVSLENNKEWKEIKETIKKLFSVDLNPPDYEKGIDTQITCTYKQNDNKNYDIISGGSGFHQALTLLAFFYGYKGLTTILFDEPDAHMHTNLQREMLDYFKTKGKINNLQFIIATHSEEFIKGVEPTSIVSVLTPKPKRIDASENIITALSDVNNIEITQVLESSYVIYVEGESDERILRAWAMVLEEDDILKKYYFKIMGGSNKSEMKTNADKHFNGLKQFVPQIKRLMLFDYDTEETAFHPSDNNPALFEWERKNIENYLLISDAWIRASMRHLNYEKNNLFMRPVINIIENFYLSQNLTLPINKTWKNVDANIFSVVDGKKILFENYDSLFQQLRRKNSMLILNRESIAENMLKDEIHQDVVNFFTKLSEILGGNIKRL